MTQNDSHFQASMPQMSQNDSHFEVFSFEMTQNDSFSGLSCPTEHPRSLADEPPATPPSPQNDTPGGDPSADGHLANPKPQSAHQVWHDRSPDDAPPRPRACPQPARTRGPKCRKMQCPARLPRLRTVSQTSHHRRITPPALHCVPFSLWGAIPLSRTNDGQSDFRGRKGWLDHLKWCAVCVGMRALPRHPHLTESKGNPRTDGTKPKPR